MYIHLSSNDSKSLFPENTGSDFIVELNSTVSGMFEAALVDFQCPTIIEDLYVFCDIVTPSFLRDSDLPILREVRTSGEPTHLHYFPVSRSDIQRIKITIRDRNMRKPNLSYTSCILHLRPIKAERTHTN